MGGDGGVCRRQMGWQAGVRACEPVCWVWIPGGSWAVQRLDLPGRSDPIRFVDSAGPGGGQPRRVRSMDTQSHPNGLHKEVCLEPHREGRLVRPFAELLGAPSFLVSVHYADSLIYVPVAAQSHSEQAAHSHSEQAVHDSC